MITGTSGHSLLDLVQELEAVGRRASGRRRARCRRRSADITSSGVGRARCFHDVCVGEALAHDMSHPAAHQRVVVDDQDLHSLTPSSVTGSLATTRVPSPGVELTSSVPCDIGDAPAQHARVRDVPPTRRLPRLSKPRPWSSTLHLELVSEALDAHPTARGSRVLGGVGDALADHRPTRPPAPRRAPSCRSPSTDQAAGSCQRSSTLVGAGPRSAAPAPARSA